MAAKKSESKEPESSEFATQKIDRAELMAEIGEQKQQAAATQKIDDSLLEATVAQSEMDSGATMKVSQAELKQAMEDEMKKGTEPPAAAQEKEPPLSGQVMDKPVSEGTGDVSLLSKINPTVAVILGVAIVLAGCICGCLVLIAALISSGYSP